jgi:DNA repair protein RadC
MRPKIIPEIVISYNPPINTAEKPTVSTSHIAYTLFMEYFPMATIGLQERFVVMYLNQAHKPLGILVASIGGMTSTVADIRLILAVALKTCSTKIMACHNHPSSNLKPSQIDIDLTNRLKEACALLDIKFIDHLVVTPTPGEYYSFNDEGML